VNADGPVWFYHYDHRGNTAVISDGNGAAICAYSYLPYGGIWKRKENSPGNRFTFMGAFGVSDEEDGFYLTATRCYDSAAGRFIQQDTRGFVGGQNLYAYADGNPVTRVDPEGTDPFTLLAITAAGIGALYLGYKAVQSAKSVGDSTKKYNEKLSALEKARENRDKTMEAFVSGKATEEQLYKAEDNYRNALNAAAKQAGETGKTAVYEYGIPGGGATQEVIKDLNSCATPSD
jgi:RHS repeat-associated protein